jgi:hypothetical protein
MGIEREGGCHCGGVRFTVQLPEVLEPRRCNCSICGKKGAAMVDVPLADLTITQGEELLTLYTFHTHEAKHRFCSRCGIHPFHQTRTAPDRFGINVACLDGVDPYAFPLVPISDGTRHAKDHGGTFWLSGWLRFDPAKDQA